MVFHTSCGKLDTQVRFAGCNRQTGAWNLDLNCGGPEAFELMSALPSEQGPLCRDRIFWSWFTLNLPICCGAGFVADMCTAPFTLTEKKITWKIFT